MRSITVYFTLALMLLVALPVYSQRELQARPTPIIPAIRDLFKSIPDTPIEWTRTDTMDPFIVPAIPFTTFILEGRYLVFPLVNDNRGHKPALVVLCSKGFLYSAVLRVHGSNSGPVKLLVITDRKNILMTGHLYDADRLDPAGGLDRNQSVNYTLMDIAYILKQVVGSSTVEFNAVGLAVRFDMPIRPVGIDSTCHIR